MLQDLVDSIERTTVEIGEKEAEKAKREEQAANDKKELESTIADRDEDVKYLSDLEAECDQKGKSFEEKQALRAEEIEALGKAIEILSGEAVSGAAEKHLPGQRIPAGASLAQLRSSTRRASAQKAS